MERDRKEVFGDAEEKKKSTVNDELMLNLWPIKHSDYFFLGMYVL